MGRWAASWKSLASGLSRFWNDEAAKFTFDELFASDALALLMSVFEVARCLDSAPFG